MKYRMSGDAEGAEEQPASQMGGTGMLDASAAGTNPAYANVPRPWFVGIFTLSRCRGEKKKNGDWVVLPRKDGHPTKLGLMELAAIQALILADATALALLAIRVVDWQVRTLAVLFLYGISGALLSYCWDRARTAYEPMRKLLEADAAAQQEFVSRYIKAFKPRRDVPASLVIAVVFALLFVIADKPWSEGLVSIRPLVVFIISAILFLPPSSGLYWLYVLHREVRNLSHLDLNLKVENPVDPISTPALDRLWGVLIWTYMSFLILIFVCGLIWSVPNACFKKQSVPATLRQDAACKPTVVWFGEQKSIEGKRGSPNAWAESLRWADENRDNRDVVSFVLASLAVAIGVAFLLSYLGMARIVAMQHHFTVSGLWADLANSPAGQDLPAKRALLECMLKSAPKTHVTILNGAVGLLLALATAAVQWVQVWRVIVEMLG